METIERTQTGLNPRVSEEIVLGDSEIGVRHHLSVVDDHITKPDSTDSTDRQVFILEKKLPESFREIEDLVSDGWCLDTCSERNAKRTGSTMEESMAFYEKVMYRAGNILRYLDKVSLEDIRPEQQRLLQLMLMLAEVSFPVERHGQPITPDAVDTIRLRYWIPSKPDLVP